jgi:hypothetical protein
MHLEEGCMLEGNDNGLDVDHLSCVGDLHSNGKLCMQMCRTRSFGLCTSRVDLLKDVFEMSTCVCKFLLYMC